MAQVENMNWDIICLCGTWIKEQHLRILNNGHALYIVGQDDGSQHGVGILIQNKLTGNIVSTQKISSRIVQIKLRGNKKYNPQITQVYAPTCNSSTEE